MAGKQHLDSDNVVLQVIGDAPVEPDARRSNSCSSASTAPNISMPRDGSAPPASDQRHRSFTEQLLDGAASCNGSHCGSAGDSQAANGRVQPSASRRSSGSTRLQNLAARLQRKQPPQAHAHAHAHAKDHFKVPHPEKLASPGNELADRRRLFEYRDIYAGSVYFAPHWERYSTWRRFFHIFSPTVCYKVLLAILPAMLTVVLSTLACALYQGLRPEREGWPDLQDTDLKLPYATVSFALSLLLVFKTNTCYARFWEARASWGATFTYTRMFMIRAQTYAYNAPVPMRQLLLRWAIAMPYLMRMHIEEYRGDAGNMQALLTPAELAYLQRDAYDGGTRHQPLLCLEVLATAIAKLKLRSPCQADLLDVLERYMGCCATNERIARTPIPPPYSRHTTRFIIWYVVFLPLGLWTYCTWATLFIAPLITFMLAGIENIGVQIENPFKSGVLPMHAYCATMQHDLLSCAGEWAAGVRDGGHLVDEVLKGKAPRWQRNRSDSDDDESDGLARASAASAGLPCPPLSQVPESHTPAGLRREPGSRHDASDDDK